jgi:PAS domain S-box-containing protein
MKDQDKTKQQLICELEELRRRVAGIDDPKRTHEALRESVERFRKVFEEGPIGLLLVGTDGRIQHANRRFCEMLGYSESEIIAVGLAGISHADDWERDHPFVSRLWRGEISYYQAEKRYLRKDGQVVWGQLTVSLMHDEAGRPMNTIGMIEDITERKQAEEALRKAHDELEQRVHERTAELAKADEDLAIFRRFAEASGEGLGMSDFDGRIAYVNPTLCRLFGGEKPEDVIGQKVFTYYQKEYVQKRQDELIPTLLREGHWHAEQTVLPRHGKPISTLQSTFLIRDENGNPFRIAVVISDITERKQAEEALAESEAKYRHLVETTDTGYVILDGEGRVMDANVEYVRLTGHRSLSEILGRRVEEWTAPHDAVRNAREIQKCLEKGAVRQLEVDYRGPDGTVTPIEANASVIETKQGKQIITLCRDITERKRVEEALRHTLDQLQAVYDGLVEGLIITDVETKRFARVNPALCRMLGYSEQELLVLSLKDIHPPEEVANDLARFRAVAEGQVSIHEGRPVLRKDGSIFYADIVARAISYNGRSCTLALWHDVTERKRAQEALERERRTLQHMLRASDHERQLIAYDIHDGLAQQIAGALMQLDVFDHQRASQPKQAAGAFQAGMTMLRQSHFEARRLINGVRPPILDESGVVAAIAHLVHEPRGRKAPEIEFHSKVHFDRLEGVEENAIYRIVQEGITNACKHSKSKKVRVSLLQRGNRVRIEIRDWGVGFNPGALPEQRFGLTGIRERARLLGGKCMMRSKPGDGTAIIVELPVVERSK